MSDTIEFVDRETEEILISFSSVSPTPEYREPVEINDVCYLVVGFKAFVHTHGSRRIGTPSYTRRVYVKKI